MKIKDVKNSNQDFAFTKTNISKFSCPKDKKQVFAWAKSPKGFGLRATHSGSSFVFQGRLGNQTIRVTIGDIRTLTKQEAEKKAIKLQAQIDEGLDPRQAKKDRIQAGINRDQEEKKKAVTVKEAWEKYLEDRKPKWSDRHYFDHQKIAQPGGEPRLKGKEKTKPGPLAALMPLKLSEITQSKISAWLKKEAAARGARARLAFSLFRAFLKWCNDQEAYKDITPVDVCSTRLKKKFIPKMTAKNDCLQREQLGAWFKAVMGLGNKVIAAYLQTLLLTGARREELAAAKWDDLNFQWKSFRIHDKVENDREIPLTPYVAYLLSNLPRKSAYIFHSPTAAAGKIAEPRHAHNRAMAVAGIEGLTIHGLRRSFGTLSEWVECPVGVVAQIMGHKPSAIAEKHYRRRPLDLLRMWHEKIEKFILDEAGIAQPETATTPGLKIVEGYTFTGVNE